MKQEEVNKMFENNGITFEDLHNYTRYKYKLDDGYNEFEPEDIQRVIDRVKEWKDGIKND